MAVRVMLIGIMSIMTVIPQYGKDSKISFSTEETVCFSDHGSVVIVSGKKQGEILIINKTNKVLKIEISGKNLDDVIVEPQDDYLLDLSDVKSGVYEVNIVEAESGEVICGQLIFIQ